MSGFNEDEQKLYETLAGSNKNFVNFWTAGGKKKARLNGKTIDLSQIRSGNRGVLINGRNYLIIDGSKKSSWTLVKAIGQQATTKNDKGFTVKRKGDLEKYKEMWKTRRETSDDGSKTFIVKKSKKQMDEIYIKVNEEVRGISPAQSRVFLLLANQKDILAQTKTLIGNNEFLSSRLNEDGYVGVYNQLIDQPEPKRLGNIKMSILAKDKDFDKELSDKDKKELSDKTKLKKIDRKQRYYELDDKGNKILDYTTTGGETIYKKKFRTGVNMKDPRVQRYNMELEEARQKGKPLKGSQGTILEPATEFTTDYKKKVRKYDPEKYKVEVDGRMLDEEGKKLIAGKILRIDLLERARFGIYFRGKLLPAFRYDDLSKADNSWRLINTTLPERDRALFWQMSALPDKEAIMAYIQYYSKVKGIPTEVINTALYYANTEQAQENTAKIAEKVKKGMGEEKLYTFNVNPTMDGGREVYFINDGMKPTSLKNLQGKTVQNPLATLTKNNMRIVLGSGTKDIFSSAGQKPTTLPPMVFDPRDDFENKVRFWKKYKISKKKLSNRFPQGDKELPENPKISWEDAGVFARNFQALGVGRAEGIETKKRGLIDNQELGEAVVEKTDQLEGEMAIEKQMRAETTFIDDDGEPDDPEARLERDIDLQRQKREFERKVTQERDERYSKKERDAMKKQEEARKFAEGSGDGNINYTQEIEDFEKEDLVPDISKYGHQRGVQLVCKKYNKDFTYFKKLIKMGKDAPSKDYNTRKRYADICLAEYSELIYVDKLTSDYEYDEICEINTLKYVYKQNVREERQAMKHTIKLYDLLSSREGGGDSGNMMDGLSSGFILNTEAMGANPQDLINAINKQKSQGGTPQPEAPPQAPGGPEAPQPPPTVPEQGKPTMPTVVPKGQRQKPRKPKKEKMKRQKIKPVKFNTVNLKVKKVRIKTQQFVNLGKQNPPQIPLSNFKFRK